MSNNVSWRAGASWQNGPKTAVKRFVAVEDVNRRLAMFRESWAVLVATGGENMQAVTVDLDCLFDDLAQLLGLENDQAAEWLNSCDNLGIEVTK